MKRNPRSRFRARAQNVDAEPAEAKRLEKLLASEAQRDDEVAIFVPLRVLRALCTYLRSRGGCECGCGCVFYASDTQAHTQARCGCVIKP